MVGKSCKHLECFIDENPFLNCTFNKVDNCRNSTRVGRKNSAVKLQNNFMQFSAHFPPQSTL